MFKTFKGTLIVFLVVIAAVTAAVILFIRHDEVNHPAEDDGIPAQGEIAPAASP